MLIFNVNVEPEAQKQTRFRLAQGRIFTYNPSKPYIDRMKWQLKAFAPSNPLLGPIEMTICFFLKIPKSTSAIKRTQMIAGKILHMKKPDVDNLAYAVTNACKGIVYKDDSQVVRLIAQKMYADDSRIVVKIRELNDTIFNFNLGEYD